MQNQDYKEYEHSDGYQNYGASQNDGDYQSYGQESAESYQESLNGMPPKKTTPKKRKSVRKVAAVTGLALLFGGIAGASFYGVTYLTGLKSPSSGQIAKADIATLQQTSSKSTDTDLTKLVKQVCRLLYLFRICPWRKYRTFLAGHPSRNLQA